MHIIFTDFQIVHSRLFKIQFQIQTKPKSRTYESKFDSRNFIQTSMKTIYLATFRVTFRREIGRFPCQTMSVYYAKMTPLDAFTLVQSLTKNIHRQPLGKIPSVCCPPRQKSLRILPISSSHWQLTIVPEVARNVVSARGYTNWPVIFPWKR